MFDNFRQSMAWLHTWFGLVLGFVLMVVFFFGSLSVFDREIDRWALPETRIPIQPMPSFDKVLAPLLAAIIDADVDQRAEAGKRVTAPLPERLDAITWSAYATHRDPVLKLYAEFAVPNSRLPDDHIHGHITIDPRDGRTLPGNRLALGSAFFYPMHFSLHLTWLNLGYWIVGFATIVMLAALISGVVMHRKIFREFFTFRPKKRVLRSTLDLHNLSGVVALPFHFLWALSGLVIFAGFYLPVVGTMMQPLERAEARLVANATGLDLKPSAEPGTLASVDAMVADAKTRWAASGSPGDVGYLSVTHVGRRNAYVSLYRDSVDRIGSAPALHYHGSSGRLLFEEPPHGAISTVNDFLVRMHLQQFRHWTLRWLIFAGGLLACVCIATGFVFFVEKRKVQHARQGNSGSRWADALAVTTVTGMAVAVLAALIANRLLPIDLPARDAWEKGAFWVSWLVALAHALWRSKAVLKAHRSPAWQEQSATIGVLAVLAVLLNAATTGDHLLRTLGTGYWPVAGVDLMLLLTAACAAHAVRRLRSRAPVGQPSARQHVVDDDVAEIRHG